MIATKKNKMKIPELTNKIQRMKNVLDGLPRLNIAKKSNELVARTIETTQSVMQGRKQKTIKDDQGLFNPWDNNK